MIEIVLPLDAGGMREVYRARDTRLERTAAIKSCRIVHDWIGDGLRARQLPAAAIVRVIWAASSVSSGWPQIDSTES